MTAQAHVLNFGPPTTTMLVSSRRVAREVNSWVYRFGDGMKRTAGVFHVDPALNRICIRCGWRCAHPTVVPVATFGDVLITADFCDDCLREIRS